MAKFTKGPWQIWEGPAYVGGGEDLCIGAGEEWLANMNHPMCRMRYVRGQEVCEIDEKHIDICSMGEDVTEIQRANAKLIARAPEMYDVLNRLLQWDQMSAPEAIGDLPFWKSEIEKVLKDL